MKQKKIFEYHRRRYAKQNLKPNNLPPTPQHPYFLLLQISHSTIILQKLTGSATAVRGVVITKQQTNHWCRRWQCRSSGYYSRVMIGDADDCQGVHFDGPRGGCRRGGCGGSLACRCGGCRWFDVHCMYELLPFAFCVCWGPIFGLPSRSKRLK